MADEGHRAAGSALFGRDAPFLGVSLKMYLGWAAGRDWLRQLRVLAPDLHPATTFVLPPFPLVPVAAELLGDTEVHWGAQDVAHADAGPYTGEVSAPMLAELGCVVAEVGHAERRAHFGEDDALIAAKAAAASRAGLVPLVCVGEQDRTDVAATCAHVRGQLAPVLSALPVGAAVLVAYEPVWAIGAAEPADPVQVTAVVRSVREQLASRTGPAAVLYGGAVGPGIAARLGSAGPGAPDGVFVGRAALDPAQLVTMAAELAATRHSAGAR